MTVESTALAPPSTRLSAEGARIGYGGRAIIDGIDVEIPPDSFTVIIGPNACGKSTLLRALSRLLRPTEGRIVLDGGDIHALAPREVARRLGLLPQSSTAPEGIRVSDLVMRGRFPHRSLLGLPRPEDHRAVTEALEATGTAQLAGRLVEELSGGQRQRVWIAMVLAQHTDLLLLDEPTTFLDIAHQISVLDVCARLHREGRTVLAVLHDLHHSCRYGTHLIAMKDGAIIAQGPPADIVTAELIEEVYDLPCVVVPDPVTGTPMVVPR